MCLQADAGGHHGQAQRCRAHVAHDVSALRGEALRQGDIIADLRIRLRSTEVTPCHPSRAGWICLTLTDRPIIYFVEL